ncbi:hypothetical protein [Methanothermococcus okinawensis]|uniref:FlpE-related protein n=1 Tax=Methanothermococcus okinawensis (strain DSM 14208 / JCM 11175 / IH1) TaxID=647113 RepID=F8AN90_METOI|nr:hypothetical protein [Methanothermococcus okinawensis]AEH06149.1 FlpE-related protein [Methanothermococcus okinawensis IH1]
MLLTVSELCIKRPEKNPKNAELELNTDWSIDYNKKEDGFEYKCKLKTDGAFPFKISVKGMILDNDFNEVPEEVSLKILNNVVDIIPNLLNLSKEKEIKIKMDIPLNIKDEVSQKIAS